MGNGIYRGSWSYVDVIAKEGPRKGALLPVGKYAREVICESQERVQDWVYVGKAIARMMGLKGMVSITPASAYKGCFFVDSVGRVEWLQEQGRMIVKGGSVFLRR